MRDTIDNSTKNYVTPEIYLFRNVDDKNIIFTSSKKKIIHLFDRVFKM